MKKPSPMDLSNYQSDGMLGSDEKMNEHMGDYLIRKRIINSEILYYSLRRQEQNSKILGEILVEEGFVPIDLMREYTLNRLFNPNRSESLARLLLGIGKIDEAKLKELKLRQRQSGRSLGSILIDEGIISAQDFTQEKFVEMWKVHT
jgi:hypothetical protein